MKTVIIETKNTLVAIAILGSAITIFQVIGLVIG